MSDDLVVALMAWLASVLAIAGLAVVALVVGAFVGIGYVAFLIGRAGYRALQGPPVRRELRRIERDRSAAIHRIIAIRQEATLQMIHVADPRVIDGHAEEIEE